MSTSAMDTDAQMQAIRRRIGKVVLWCTPIMLGIWLFSSYKELAAAWTHHGVVGVLGKVGGDALGFMIIRIVLGALVIPTAMVAKKTGKKLAAFAFGLAYAFVFCLALYGLECLTFLVAPQWFQGTWQAPLTLSQLEGALLSATVVGLFIGWLGTQALTPFNTHQHSGVEEGELPNDGAVVE